MNFASLYSGCGGFDIGFIEQGFQSVAAYDFDRDACLNFKDNIGGHVLNVDLRDGIPCSKALHGIDVLIAGPPCQGFSTAGKRRIDDERNHHIPRTAELALEISPKVLVVENVPGVLSGGHRHYWDSMNVMMQLAGYRTSTCRYQTSDLGMAQERKRVLFFAWKTGIEIDFSVPPVLASSLRSALEDVKGKVNHNPKRLKPNTKDWRIARRIKPGQKLSNVRGGENAVASWDIPEVFGHITKNERTILELLRRLRRQSRQRDHGDADPVSFDRLEEALGSRFHYLVERLIDAGYLRRIKDGIDLVGTFNGKYRRLDWDKPSSTVDTRFGSPRYFLHPDYHRGFTVREAARLQGFNDSYIFKGSENSQYRIIGNAVPPPLANMAAKITKRLLG